MILVVCTDDKALLAMAQKQSREYPEVFGQCYQVFKAVPSLGVGEDLFITAHGAYEGDDGNPVIGDKKNAFYINAVELWQALEACFPKSYSGRVYISACESSDHGEDFSFAEVFEAQLHGARSKAGPVYGQKGAVGLRIPFPNDPGWIAATDMVV